VDKQFHQQRNALLGGELLHAQEMIAFPDAAAVEIGGVEEAEYAAPDLGHRAPGPDMPAQHLGGLYLAVGQRAVLCQGRWCGEADCSGSAENAQDQNAKNEHASFLKAKRDG
jgi:hypothetical protein